MHTGYPKAYTHPRTRQAVARAMREVRRARDGTIVRGFERRTDQIRLKDGRTFSAAIHDHRLWRNLSGQGGRRLELVDEDLSWLVAPRIDLAEVRFEKVRLRNANLVGADLRGSWFDEVDFFGASINHSAASLAQFHKCDFTKADLSGSRIDEACFARCSGLHGSPSQCASMQDLTGSDLALASKERFFWEWRKADHGRGVLPIGFGNVAASMRELKLSNTPLKALQRALNLIRALLELTTSWNVLRGVGSFLVVGSASISVAGIVGYARFRNWYNDRISTARKAGESTAFNSPDPTVGTSDESRLEGISDTAIDAIERSARERIIDVLPYPLPLPNELVLLLVAFGLIGLASLAFKLFCPTIVQEYSHLRWTRELRSPPLEYASANFSQPFARLFTAILYLFGGVYLLGYFIFRAADVVLGALWPPS